jgi:hypothetical protein
MTTFCGVTPPPIHRNLPLPELAGVAKVGAETERIVYPKRESAGGTVRYRLAVCVDEGRGDGSDAGVV